ncbi:MAG: RNA polymerase sigma factor [Pseudomonadota bacterium]
MIKRALDGSERAWLALVKRYEGRLYNYALRMSGNPDDAMDILQDVLMSVYRNLASFRGDSQFSTWLFRIAAFRSTDFFRRKKWQPSHLVDEAEPADPSESHSPEYALVNAQDNRDIARLMSQLPTEQRQVVELKYFQHFTFDEIAGQLGISPNTAKTRLYAALQKMRATSAIVPAIPEPKCANP